MLEISINMILDRLREYRPEQLFSEELQFSFSSLQLYERGQKRLSPENIYMCGSGELTAEAAESGCCFLCIHRMEPGMKLALQGKRIVLLEDENIGLAEVFNAVQSLFANLREWHQNMHVSLIQNNNVQELLDLSEGVIGNPIVLVNLGFKLLAHTKNIQTDDEVYNELISRGYHAKQVVERLTNIRQVDRIKKASVVDVAFPLPQVSQYPVVTRTFYLKGAPYAYLRMICSTHLPSKSLEERFALLAESVEYYLYNHYSSESVSKYIYEYVLVELIEKKLKEESEIRERIKCVGLQDEAEYQLLKIVLEDEANTSVEYIQDQLMAIFLEGRPFVYNGNIMVLIGQEGRYGGAEERRERQFSLLRELLRSVRGRCGMSEAFHSIRLISDAYVQTTVAVELGLQLWQRGLLKDGADGLILPYRSCYVYHLISACSQQVSLRSLCNEQLLAIKEQDELKNTDYANLLYTYLINQGRATDTAKVLHMHRNNVIYHVERFSEQLGVDLSDPESRLRLLLSYKVMDLL